ncbi:MAG TPA: hypothetical protein VN884_04430 [Candidatus Sulfotelmatobacter sp.]|nr:hypothetical protein [Candidatus Sulfotelmatobacter sp.]
MPLKLTKYDDPAVLNKWSDGIELQLANLKKATNSLVVAPGQTSSLTMDQIGEGTKFGKPLQASLTPGGSVDPTGTGFVSNKGVIPPVVVGGTANIITWTTTTTSATFTWAAIQLLWPDKSSLIIPAGSFVVSGLSASQTYFAYPYWSFSFPTQVLWAIVAGGLGKPAAFYQPQSPTATNLQNLQGNTPLSTGGLDIVTPASGSGGGGGGGSKLCVRNNVVVSHREKGPLLLAECEVGDWIRGRTDWTQIKAKRVLPFDKFVRFTLSNGESVSVTPTHHMTTADERSVAAQDIKLSDFLLTTEGVATIRAIEWIEESANKISVTCEPEHEYFAGEKTPSILVHNFVPLS